MGRRIFVMNSTRGKITGLYLGISLLRSLSISRVRRCKILRWIAKWSTILMSTLRISLRDSLNPWSLTSIKKSIVYRRMRPFYCQGTCRKSYSSRDKIPYLLLWIKSEYISSWSSISALFQTWQKAWSIKPI